MFYHHIINTTNIEVDAPLLLSYMQNLRHNLPLFRFVDQDPDLTELQTLAQHIRHRFSDVIILGTGGSSLGGQTLCSLSREKSPRIHFHDNIDPDTFERLFSEINPSKTAVIAISKSGNTAETLMQLLTCIQHWSSNGQHPNQHFWIVAEPEANGIREIAAYYDLTCFDHPQDINGRVAAFTIVGLLPALIAGLDARAVNRGARSVLDQITNAKTPEESPPLAGAMLNYALSLKGYTQAVLMPYVDRLNYLTLWYRQLWAESLGKNGKGTTPIHAVGTVDQHSQLQLYLDGPKDKFFTLITMDHSAHTFNVGALPFHHSALSIFNQKSMGQLMMAEQQATLDTLKNHGCPTRLIHLTMLTEEVMGALLMHFVIETFAMAHLLEVNAFDQPAVEESKVLTRKYLLNQS